MTEKIIAPDVYTSETDNSFVSQAQVKTGLAIIGPTEKGEAFIPTDISSFTKFGSKFGQDNGTSYVPQAVLNYLNQGSSVKVTRVLGNGGWSFDGVTKKIAALVNPGQAATLGTTSSLQYLTSSILSTYTQSRGREKYINIVGDSSYIFKRTNIIPSLDLGSNVINYNTGSNNTQTIQNLVTSINANKALYSITASYLTGSTPGYITLNSLNTGSIYNSYLTQHIYDDLSITSPENTSIFEFVSGSDPISAISAKIITVLHPSNNDNITIANLNSSSVTGTNDSFYLTVNGTQINKTVSASLNQTNSNYIAKVIGSDENFQSGSAFAYLNFNSFYNQSVSPSATVSMSLNTSAVTFTSSYTEGYDSAKTPWVLSDGGVRLFRFVNRSHGFKTNKDVKISISNITKSTSDSVYSSFNVLVRKWNDTDKNPSILEQYNNVTLNPNSAAYIGRQIGDKYNEYDSTHDKIVNHGNYVNISDYTRIEISDTVEDGSLYSTSYPNGFEAIQETIAGFSGLTLPTASLSYSTTSSTNYSGFDYSKTDNLNYVNPVPLEATAGENINFVLPSNDNKFTIPFQGGTDGMMFGTIKKIGSKISPDGTNVFGFDLSTSTSSGTAAFTKAINILGNKKEYKFNTLTIPGVVDEYHSSVTALAESMVEERTDAVYIRDLTGIGTSIAAATQLAAGIDSSYSATYYPWVKVRSLASSKDVFVPPSVVVPQTFAYTARVRGPWYAPGGFTQGVLGGVIDTYTTINHQDIADLYEAKINPLAKFPGKGIIVWGQKTLQTASTLLNRINVRNLLIELRTYISDASENLIFEQNTTVTRNKFYNMVDPYLSNIKQKQGLYDYKIVMDDTNNTADVIDRNQLVGAIYLQPTTAVEYIILDFNINPSGVDLNAQ